MKYIISILFLFLSAYGFCQHGFITLRDKPFVYNSPLDSAVWKNLEQEPLFATLNKQEQEFFYWTNVFRKSPRQFYTSVVKDFIKQFPEADKPEVKTLENDIKIAPITLTTLAPDAGLLKMSSAHATDLFKREGIISHTSSTGKGFVQRVNETGFYRCAAENLYVGNNNALEALIILLIDYGVPDKGHRLNLLDPLFGKMGVAFSELNQKKVIIVQVFACK